MSRELTPAERALLITGCKLYLDVIHTTNAFQTLVCPMARDVINATRDRIARIAKLEGPLKPASIHVEPKVPDDHFTGSQAWVGATIRLDKPIYGSLYLALVFHRDPNDDTQTADICFALQVWTRELINQYGDIFREHPDCRIYDDDRDWRAVELRRPLENPSSMRQELKQMLDDALTWWNNATTNGASA